MKIFVMYEFKSGPYGGANQFLKAINAFFKEKGYIAEKVEEADIILFNSSNYTKEVVEAKKKYPEKVFVERLDGPAKLYLHKNNHDKRDLIANLMNHYVADATIFQSEYSRKANYKLGLHKNVFEATILNAPDGTIFNTAGKKEFNHDEKIKIVASSWSANWNKGFEVYRYLDNVLDFQKYTMYFIGNSPIDFQNIRILEALPSKELAEFMKSCDIYITASENDSCPNSLIEAIFCGLPAIALNKGGHPEIVGEAGLLFERKEEIPDLLEQISCRYETYAGNFRLLNRDQTGEKYIEFLKNIYDDKQRNHWKSKRFTTFHFLWLKIILIYIRVSDKFWRTIRK